jgi:DNA-binding transcriptional ArsR family regulator
VIKHEVALDVAAITHEQIRAAMPDEPEMVQIARTFQALADPTRCKIILALTRLELCVTDLATIVGASTSGVSHHLKGLKDIRLVKFRRDGNTIYYSIDDAHVGNLFREAIYHLDHVRLNLPDHQLAGVK